MTKPYLKKMNKRQKAFLLHHAVPQAQVSFPKPSESGYCTGLVEHLEKEAPRYLVHCVNSNSLFLLLALDNRSRNSFGFGQT